LVGDGWGAGDRIDPPSGGGDDGGMEARIAHLEATTTSIDKRLGRVEDDVRALSDKVDRRFDELSAKMDRHFLWLVSAIAGLGLCAVTAATFVYREAPGKTLPPAATSQSTESVAPAKK
jgi:hypothetical protein